MAELLDFPNELLCKIAGFVHFERLENFAETCKRVYMVSRPLVLENRPTLIHKHYNYRNFGTKAIARLLIRVFQNRGLGRYIREIEIRSLATQHHPLDGEYTDRQICLLNEAAAGLRLLG